MSANAPTAPRTAEIACRTPPRWPRTLHAVVRRGLHDQRRSTLIWGLSLGTYGAFMAAVYPSIQGSIDQMLKNYPAALKQAFDVTSMSTVEGYIQTEMFSLIAPLALGYFVIREITSATVGAEERGHLDTILSLPISRSVLMAGSCIVAAVTAGAVMVLTGMMTFVVGRVAGTNISLGLVTAGALGIWPLALLAGGIAAAAAGVVHGGRAASGIALGVLIAMYAVDLVGKLAHGLEAIRWASAFKYYGSPMRDGIDPMSFIGLAAVAVVLMAVGALSLERRDILH